MTIVEQRLARIERKTRLWKLLGGLSLLGLVAVMLMGQAREGDPGWATSFRSKRIEAEEFVLTDSSGAPRARWVIKTTGQPALQFVNTQLHGDKRDETVRLELGLSEKKISRLVLYDQGGEMAGGFWAGEDGGAVILRHKKKMRVGLMVEKDGQPSLGLFDPEGKLRVSLLIPQDGSLGVVLGDQNGNLRLGLTVQQDGTPGLVLRDQNGKDRAMLFLLSDGSPTPTLGDQNRRDRAVLLVQQDGSALAFTDRNGKVIWQAP